MSHPYPNDALRASELRTRALLGQVDDGPQLGNRLAELLMTGGHAKVTISASSLRSAVAAYTRDLVSTTATAGGFLIGTSNSPLEALFRQQLMGRLGVNVVSGLASPITVPRVASIPSGSWIPADGAIITEAQPSLGQIALVPRYCAIKTDASRQLVAQSPRLAEAVIGPTLFEGIERTTVTALFSGTGTLGAPLGLLNTAGIGTLSGASLGAAGLRSMLKACLLAGGREDRIVFIGDPATQELLGSRDFSTGSGLPCWYGGEILGRPAIASSLVPANTLVCGDFGRATVALFDADSQGVALELDPYSAFASGLVSYRLIVSLDFGFSPAAAFAVATSIT